MVKTTRSLVQRSNAGRVGSVLLVTAVVCAIAVVIVLRLRFLSVPFERDEGEYAYGAQRMLQGALPYRDFYSLKLPGIFLIYAAFLSIFGQSIMAVHIGLLIANIFSTALIFILGRQLYGLTAALVSAAAFALLSVSLSVQGLFANAEQFVLPAALFGMVCFVEGLQKQRWYLYAASGFSLGLAFLVKQHGAAFGLFGLTFVLAASLGLLPRAPKTPWRHVALYLFGLALPYGATLLFFERRGALGDLYFWTVQYAREYIRASNPSHESALSAFLQAWAGLARDQFVLWTSALIGLQCELLVLRHRKRPPFLVGLTVFSLLAVMPGHFFRPHYFVLLLPAAALSCGSAIVAYQTFLRKKGGSTPWFGQAKYLSVAVLMISTGIVVNSFGFLTPNELSEQVYGTNLFAKMPAIADYCRRLSAPSDQLASISNEPEINFYARRTSPTGFLYLFPIVETQKFQRAFFLAFTREIEAHRPTIVVIVNDPLEGIFGRETVAPLQKWITHFLNDGYVLDREETAESAGGSPIRIGVYKRQLP